MRLLAFRNKPTFFGGDKVRGISIGFFFRVEKKSKLAGLFTGHDSGHEVGSVFFLTFTGRVESGQEVLEVFTNRIGSGRNLAARVRSGGVSRVGSGCARNLTRRIGSGRVGWGRVGLGWVTRA